MYVWHWKLRSSLAGMDFKYFLSTVLLLLLNDCIQCMEDGTTYIIGPGRIDCFHRELKNGTNMDFEMEVRQLGLPGFVYINIC